MKENKDGKPVYTLIGPSRVPLCTFTDYREAIAEAAKLNSRERPEHS
jgi:hypothetical protein